MIQTLLLGGPWKGVFSSTDPSLVGKGYVPDAENFRFRLGVAETIPSLQKEADLPEGCGTPLLLRAYVDRLGNLHTILVASGGVYVGGISSLSQITLTNWTSPTKASVTFARVSSDEYLIVVNDTDPYIFFISLPGLVVTELDMASSYPDIALTHGELCAYYKTRLVLGNLHHPTSPYASPHMVAWSDVTSPLTWELADGAGTNPLVDINGPIVSLHPLGDFLGVWQPRSLTLMRYTGVNYLPFEWTVTINGTGCVADRTTKTIPTNQLVGFLGKDNFYVTDGRQALAKGHPVLDKIRAMASFDDDSVLVTNANGVVYPQQDEYWLIFSGGNVLAWNYAEDVWSRYSVGVDIIDAVSGFVETTGTRIIDLEGRIIDLVGRIIDLSSTVSSAALVFLATDGIYRMSRTSIGSAWVRFPEVRFPKPRTISRLIFRLDAPAGGELEVRYSTNRGSTWTDWKALTINPGNSTRVFYNFLTTTETLSVEIKVTAQPALRILDVSADVSVPKGQEVTLPLAGEQGAGLDFSM